MAVYTKLLLSAGGGIVSTQQQADQAKNSATVLIGLGGTGIDCLRTIKTQVYSRLKPDNPQAVVPTYEHIRFLGVDTDLSARDKGSSSDNAKDGGSEKADSLLPLDDTEFFSIANPDIKAALSSELVLSTRKELEWLRYRDIPKPDLGEAGAGGIRQVGRFMMMERSTAFLSRVRQEIDAAKMGLDTPKVFVHIFTGISGGTGSGCFLDVCYMVRSIADSIGGVTVFGYFFLPDVNLSRIPASKTQVREYIPLNGYAAMQELDYCMQLQYNGGSFSQVYQNNRSIPWNQPPVDIAHLVCATDENNNVIPNAYEYAMNVTTEYVMDFLTLDTSGFGLTSQLSNFQQEVQIADGGKRIGSNLAYCALGAACASLPLRQINTYLASELFARFSRIGGNMPTKGDVQALAVAALSQSGGFNTVYDSLLREVQASAGSSYGSYADDWKFVRDYGNRDLVEHYTNQNAAKANRVEQNAKSMIGPGNEESLIQRTMSRLRDAIRDIERGPVYAHRMLSAAESHNLLNVVDGLLAENRGRWEQEGAQTDLRERDYESAKRDFELRRRRTMFDTDAKRFADYEHYLMLLVQHRYLMDVYERLDIVLRTYRAQVEEVEGAYYRKLARVTETLVNTFAENRDALASEKVMFDESSFVKPLMSIAELRKPMDAEIARINVPGMLDSFMGMLLQNEDEWLQEDENKICRLVTRFFVDTAFGDFAGRSITAFLADKYDTNDNEELADRVYEDWMKKLTAKARPLFYYDRTIMSVSPTPGSLAFLSVPMASAPVKAAANRMHDVDAKWQVKESALTDRIYIMGSSAALPLAGYNNNAEYERLSATHSAAGRHYYETPGLEGMPFSDWRELPPLTPQQFVDARTAPPHVAEIVGRARRLFDDGVAAGLIRDDGTICELDEGYVREMRTLTTAAKEMAGGLASAEQLPAARELLAKLEAPGAAGVVPTGNRMQDDGLRSDLEAHLKVRRDHFCSAPALQLKVEQSLEALGKVEAEVAAARDQLAARVTAIDEGGRDLEQYLNALFTGVISVEGAAGNVIVYHREEFGIRTDVELSKMGPDFPYGKVALFQGFESYKALDADTRREISKKADEGLNSGSDEVFEAGQKLAKFINDSRINAMAQLASGYQNRREIIEFLGKTRENFKTHCLIYGIA